MDIMAKKAPADKDGVRIAELNEMSYREQLWDYTPITKFWRVGKGIAEKLAQYGMYTMGLYENQRLTDSDKRVLNLTRSSYARQQRYATVVWNGDTHASCESYRQQISAGLNYMATGNPYWTVDVGSFFVKNDYSLSLLAWDDSKQKLKLKIVKKSRIYNREIKVNVVKYILANHSWE